MFNEIFGLLFFFSVKWNLKNLFLNNLVVFVPVRKVHNEWGPQTVTSAAFFHLDSEKAVDSYGLPSSIAERVVAIEKYLNIGPVSKDIYKRLKDMEDKIAYLQAVSPEYAQFWVSNNY